MLQATCSRPSAAIVPHFLAFKSIDLLEKYPIPEVRVIYYAYWGRLVLPLVAVFKKRLLLPSLKFEQL